MSGASGWNEIEDYAHSKRDWLKSFLKLPGGIPSHDTFNRVFAALDPEELEKGFAAWVSSIAQAHPHLNQAQKAVIEEVLSSTDRVQRSRDAHREAR